MFAIIWRYSDETEIHFATVTSRELHNMCLDPCIKIIQYKPVKKKG